MRQFRFFACALAGCLTVVLTAQSTPPQTPPQPPAGQRPIEITIGPEGRPPRLAVPEFIAATKDPETVKAARTIGQVLYDDIEYEKEFYMIPRDIMKTIPQPSSVGAVQLDRWKEIGADGLIVGSVRRSGDGVVVEVRLIQVASGEMKLGKEYSGTLKSLADGGRMYAHTFADLLHKDARNVRGVARTKLTFSSNRSGEQLARTVAPRDVSNIYMVDYDGANERRVTMGKTLEITPVWSPDGRAIAYTSYLSSYPDIAISYIYEGRLVWPARGTSDTKNYLPAWSHDGERIAYTSALPDGNVEIFIMNRDGSGKRRVTNHPMGDVTPTWSPSGTQLAFVSDRSGSPQIYIVELDGTNLRKISTESYCDRPTWSAPPLNQIAYTCRGGGGYQIMLYDFETGTSKPISDGIGSNESPAFAPNGRHIAFVSDRTGRQQIYTMHVDGTGLRQITKTGTNKYPNWSQ